MTVAPSLLNGLTLLAAVGVLGLLLAPHLRQATFWRATVTPLASIIGSGFLVVAPLFAFMAGQLAVLAIAMVVLLAWLVGGAVRFNIRHVEQIVEIEDDGAPLIRLLQWLERASKLALSIAYVIAVAFYLELLGAFLLRLVDIESHVAQKMIATLLLLLIGGVGFRRGLRMLEGLEEYAVAVKLAIIAGFLAALAAFNGGLAMSGQWQWPDLTPAWNRQTFFQLLGALLIVQGFETSRYLQGVYSPELRIRSMQRAQWLSGGIYVLFIALATPLFGHFTQVSETGIIDLSKQVAPVLPFLLVLGAVMAQFSAAVADTISSGGLVEEASRGRIRHRRAYVVSTAFACLLLWTTDIFAVIAYASRAFAAFYALQTMIAAVQAFWPVSGNRAPARGLLYLLLTLLMLMTVLFGSPVETSDA